MKKIPTVKYGLLGEENYITDFIQVENPKLQRIARALRGRTVDEKIQSVVHYVAANLEYPLDYRGRPTGARSVKVFKWWNGFYLADKNLDYGWLLPSQTCEVKKGICFDSSCLATTLLRLKKVEALTVLGIVLRSKNKRILGPHAWTETVDSKGERLVLETTVHPKPAKLVSAKKMYLGKLPVTYDPLAWFNELSYVEDKKKTRKYEVWLDD